jgi:POT family proton-dependent oligopeptide transporter
MAESKYQTAPVSTEDMPKGIPYIIGNEAAERFSFYGMNTVLMVFMTQHLVMGVDAGGKPEHMDREQAMVWIHNFKSAAYFFPIVGAILADWLIGKYYTIIGLSMLYCVGHSVLALMEIPVDLPFEQSQFLWVGLALIAVGAGGIKPCVSAHVGDQFGESNKHLLPRVFRWFYFSINLGAAASTILTPFLLNDERFGPAWAFGVPGVLMLLATIVFWTGRHVFVHIPPARERFFSETFSRDGLRAMVNLVPLYIFIMVFWALFDQTSSAWVLQAQNMDRMVFGHEILASQIQAANPILVLIMIPAFAFWGYPLMNRFFEATPLRKIGVGMFVAVIAFVIPAMIEMRIDAGQRPHVVWQFAAFVVITGAEIMISITALEFSYTQAPKKMKSFIMGLYLLSVAVGNQFTARVNDYIQAQKKQGITLLNGAMYYWFFATAMLLTACVYIVWSRFYRGQTYIQDEGSMQAVDESLA